MNNDACVDLLGYPIFVGAHVAYSSTTSHSVKHGIVKSFDESKGKIKIKGIDCVGNSKYPKQVIVLMTPGEIK